jgi:dsRNA-specific ribonuclease
MRCLATSSTLQSHPPLELSDQQQAQLSSFSTRFGFQFADQRLLLQALTHVSYKKTAETDNERLQFLGKCPRKCLISGRKIIDFYVTEYVYAKHPHMPADVLASLTEAYCGRRALGSLAKHFGVGHVIRCKVSA